MPERNHAYSVHEKRYDLHAEGQQDAVESGEQRSALALRSRQPPVAAVCA